MVSVSTPECLTVRRCRLSPATCPGCSCVPGVWSQEMALIVAQGCLLVSRTWLTDHISKIEARAGRHLISLVRPNPAYGPSFSPTPQFAPGLGSVYLTWRPATAATCTARAGASLPRGADCRDFWDHGFGRAKDLNPEGE